MFKKIFIAFLLSSVSFQTYSQTDSSYSQKIKFGVNISAMPEINFNLNDGIDLATQAIATKGKISILAGFVWKVNANKDENFFRGGMLSLRYFPLKCSKRLSFYFLYDLSFVFQTNQSSRYVKYDPATYYNVDFSSTIQTLRNQIGYGFIFKVYKKLFVSQSFSIGVDCYNYHSTTTVKENPALSEKYSSGGIFSNNEASNVFKIGIEYHFE
jgi:hypothetical protein